MSIKTVMPSNYLILCHPFLLLPSIFISIRVFYNESLFASGGQSIGAWVSASLPILPMNIQDWFPLGLTGLISLKSMGLSRVFSNTIVQKHQFFGTWLSVKVKVSQSCPTLQARILEGVAFPFFRNLPNPGIESRSPTLQVDSLPAEAQGKPKNTGVGGLFILQGIFPTQESNLGLLLCRWILSNWAMREIFL